ncbi:hypothetical protein UYO_1147 [Lachnospiraceae bacterium JC7]|nr:hypothetical protein UYO_1147 [Lachnospiraceae bacterium JC7]
MEKEKKLLKAIGDIDEKFIEEARPEKVVRIAPKRSRKPLGVMAAAAVIILGLGIFMTMNMNEKNAAMMAPAIADGATEEKSAEGLGSTQEKSTDDPGEAEIRIKSDASSVKSSDNDASVTEGAEERSALEDNGVQSRAMIANPWKDSYSLAEAVSDAGFDMTVPETVKTFEPTLYRSIKDDMLEIIYCDSDSLEGFRIRKSHGEEDISGDYNVYTTEKDITAGDTTIHIRENDPDVFVATWTRDDFSFAIVVEESQHFTEEDIAKLAEQIS